MTKFATIDQAAHSGANGNNQLPEATLAQRISGNYLKGRTTMYGLHIAIESPRGTLRHWQAEDGTSGTNLMKFHYGYLEGTLGNDGDELDCSTGPLPEATRAYVINQFVKGKFDEHKIMLGFPDKRTAMAGYLSNYNSGWQGLDSCVACSIEQLKWWIAHGNMARPLTQDQLPNEGTDNMDKVIWDSANNPSRSTLDQVLYSLRAHDANDGLLFDSLSMAEILEDSDGVLVLDALVLPYARIQQRMGLLQKVLDRAGGAVKVAAMQVSTPFTQRGSTNIAVIYELSDGQTVSVFFHNPDVTPKKIMATDELISWKWMLNKKDITVAVAPERGRDLDIRTVATRIMRLAERNSERFIASNSKRAEKMQAISGLKETLSAKEAELSSLEKQIEVATVERENTPPVVAPASGIITPEQDAVMQRQLSALTDVTSKMTDDQLALVGSILGIANAQMKDRNDLLDKIYANHPDDIESAIKRFEATKPLKIDWIKAVVTSIDPMPGVSVPSNWPVMNAPRPLMGTETMSNGEFLSGRFYAALDPNDSMANAYLDNNVKMDASMVFVADQATLTAMALNAINPKYLSAYMGMDEVDRADAISPFVTKLNGKTYGELKELAAKGMPVIAVPESADGKNIDQKNIDAFNLGKEAFKNGKKANPPAGMSVEEIRYFNHGFYIGDLSVPLASDTNTAAIPLAPTTATEAKPLPISEVVTPIGEITTKAVPFEKILPVIDQDVGTDHGNTEAFKDGKIAFQNGKKANPPAGLSAEEVRYWNHGYFVGDMDIPLSPDGEQGGKELAPDPDMPEMAHIPAPEANKPIAEIKTKQVPLVEPSSDDKDPDEESKTDAFNAGKKAFQDGKKANPPAGMSLEEIRYWNHGYYVGDMDVPLAAEVSNSAQSATPTAEPDAAKADATAYLQSVIDGSANLNDPIVPAELGRMHAAYKDDADMLTLFKAAVKAYSAYAVAKANAALAT